MQPIPTSFRHSGHICHLHLRECNGAIFRQEKGGKVRAWEVHGIKIVREREWQGVLMPEREVLASPEEWGIRAWTCLSLDRAMERLKELGNRVKAPKHGGE